MKKQTWLVTGTHTGFGKNLATLLAQKPNVNLVATARKPATQLNYLDQYDHGQIKKAQLDVTKHDQVVKTVQLAQQAFGGVDVLVNNAGLGYFSTFEESDWQEAHYLFDVNVWGLADVTRNVLPMMRKQKSGTIVNFSSICGLTGFLALSYYDATKHAVEGLTKTIAREVKPLGIKCMLIEPSGFRTDWGGRSSEKTVTKLADYRPVEQTIQHMQQYGSTQTPGDPMKAAKIIYDQVTNHWSTLPLHLPLGRAATNEAASELKRDLAEIKRVRKTSISADDR